MRKSKTLLQQARYYEVDGEIEMMDVMYESYVNGNFEDFKDYYRVLKKSDRRKFINYLYNNISDCDMRTFYKMVDMLMFD